MKLAARILNIVSAVLATVVVVLAVALVGVRLVGIEPYVVLSGSMSPTFDTGALVWTMPVNAADVQVNDVITFDIGDDAVATHRVVAVNGEGDSATFTTKGDANDVTDASPVTAALLKGRVVASFPYLGYVLEYIHTPQGTAVAVGIGVAIVALVALPGVLFKDDESEQVPKGAHFDSPPKHAKEA